ncbi:hypothetical protein [Pararhodobacter aggregans]|uniref:hypothetical protein n=1 Tax=Pararhodobacter aggregans TaxID=404875 RepID=UPI0014727D20|nr:hypothetical protein [Pararhodobacter aggregans]
MFDNGDPWGDAMLRGDDRELPLTPKKGTRAPRFNVAHGPVPDARSVMTAALLRACGPSSLPIRMATGNDVGEPL